MTPPNTSQLIDLRNFCAALLTASGEIALRYFDSSLGAQNKSDGTIVTEADTTIEKALRKAITSRFPAHQILGEEEDGESTDAEWLWIIDPIDGTQNFANGIPTFGTIIGLFRNGEPVVSGISHPALHLTYLAAKGLGATKNGMPLKIRPALSADLGSHELWGVSSPDIFQRDGDQALFEKICLAHPAIRIYYDCFAHTLAAEGALGAHFEIGMKIWDVAASELLVTEAGGSFRYLSKPNMISRTALYSAVFGKLPVVDSYAALIGT